MKETLKLILVLTSICAISSALLAAVYSKTKEPIEATLALRTAKAAAYVLPAGVETPVKQEIEGIPFYVARKEGAFAGAAVTGRSVNGYGGEVVLMVGISSEGKLVNFQKLVASETPGLGSKMESDTFRNPLQGRSIAANWIVKKDGGDVDAITAATISSRAALECIRDAINKYNQVATKLQKTTP